MVLNLKAITPRAAGRVAILLLAITLPLQARAHPPDHDHVHHAQTDSGTPHGSLGEVSHKLSNPLSSVWALFTEFDLNFNNGNAN